MNEDLFDPADLAELSATFESMGTIDPLTAFKAQAARWATDPELAWRQALSAACQAEGVSYHWIVEHRVSAFGYPGCPPANIGDDHLAWLASHEARPAALAAAIKAALLDPRFRAWPLPGEGDDE